MRRAIAILSFVFMIAVGVHAGPREDAAGAAGRTWLALIDAGQYDVSWQGTSSAFKRSVTQQQWQNLMTANRSPLGGLNSRELKSATYAGSLPGAPDGDYVVLVFNTGFASKKAAVETVTVELEKDGSWRSSGYFIR